MPMKHLTRMLLLCFWSSQFSLICFAQSKIITTYAGPGLPINGAPATTQSFGRVESVISDGSGGFYIAALDQNRVYRVAADGTVKLVAGSSSEIGFSGDGGPATSAKLSGPTGMAVDSAGNLYFADYIRIRKVTPAGVISTVAGGGTEYPGDGGPATSADVGGRPVWQSIAQAISILSSSGPAASEK
jgi:hypothetical protein